MHYHQPASDFGGRAVTSQATVHNSMVKFLGASRKCFFFFLKILMVSDKMIYKDFRTRVTLYAKLIREIFHFLYLPKLYIGFKLTNLNFHA